MQRLFNITKWTHLESGESAAFPTDRARMVRLEINAPTVALLYLADPESGVMRFLARVTGRDTVEFFVGGPFSIVSDGECFIYTADGQSIHHESVDPVIFTRITERRSVPPEMAHMQRMMQINIERRLAAQRDEFNSLLRGIRATAQPAPVAATPAAAVQAAPVVPAVDLPEDGDGADAGGTGGAGGAKRAKGK